MITVAKSDTKPVGNKPICLHNIVFGPDLYDVIDRTVLFHRSTPQ